MCVVRIDKSVNIREQVCVGAIIAPRCSVIPCAESPFLLTRSTCAELQGRPEAANLKPNTSFECRKIEIGPEKVFDVLLYPDETASGFVEAESVFLRCVFRGAKCSLVENEAKDD